MGTGTGHEWRVEVMGGGGTIDYLDTRLVRID